MRLIDAEKLKQANWFGNSNPIIYRSYADELIKDAPTEDAKLVVHAKWIDIYGGKYANPRYWCSMCHGKALWSNVQDELLSWHEVQALTDYCPHCGAKMDEKEKTDG